MKTLSLALALTATSSALSLNAGDTGSIKSSASTIAKSFTSIYPPNSGLLPAPYFWWESGSALDGLIAYSHSTGDTTYNGLAASTIASQATSKNDFMTADATGNDDQAWWALAAMSAAEYGIAAPAGAPSFLEMAQNVFNEQKGRWDTTRCGGGMKWKINPSDDGYHYKSSIANGLTFQLAARIGRFTGDKDALSWADMAYDWVTSVGLIDKDYNVFDGTDDSKGTGCVDVDHDQWSYNVGVFMYGAAVMSDATSDSKWSDRTNGLIANAQKNFVNNGVLFESKCEGAGTCDTDQQTFKAALARWMAATATILPNTANAVQQTLGSSAEAFAKGFGGSEDAGQQLAALEAVGGLLCKGGNGAPGKPKTGKRSVAVKWRA